MYKVQNIYKNQLSYFIDKVSEIHNLYHCHLPLLLLNLIRPQKRSQQTWPFNLIKVGTRTQQSPLETSEDQ